MKAADSDIEQLQHGVTAVTSTTPEKLLDGPFVLTDAHTQSHYTFVFHTVPTGGDCATYSSLVASDPRILAVVDTEESTSGTAAAHPLHGVRLPVRSDETLCVVQSTLVSASVYWAGFIPY
jgi:hypothetical protein